MIIFLVFPARLCFKNLRRIWHIPKKRKKERKKTPLRCCLQPREMIHCFGKNDIITRRESGSTRLHLVAFPFTSVHFWDCFTWILQQFLLCYSCVFYTFWLSKLHQARKVWGDTHKFQSHITKDYASHSRSRAWQTGPNAPVLKNWAGWPRGRLAMIVLSCSLSPFYFQEK